MTAGIVLSILVALAFVVWISVPLMNQQEAFREINPEAMSEARGLQSRHTMLLSSLKDLEDDRATDKMGEADYLEMKQKLSAQAVEVMKQLDAMKERAAQPSSPFVARSKSRSEPTA